MTAFLHFVQPTGLVKLDQTNGAYAPSYLPQPEPSSTRRAHFIVSLIGHNCTDQHMVCISHCFDHLPLLIHCPQTSTVGGYAVLAQNSDDSSPVNHDLNHRTNNSTDELLSDRRGTRGLVTFHSDSDTYTYSYGPKGLHGLWHNRYALLCAFFASLGGLTFGYDQGVVRPLFLFFGCSYDLS